MNEDELSLSAKQGSYCMHVLKWYFR